MSGDFVLDKQIIMHLDVLNIFFMNIHAKLHPLCIIICLYIELRNYLSGSYLIIFP